MWSVARSDVRRCSRRRAAQRRRVAASTWSLLVADFQRVRAASRSSGGASSRALTRARSPTPDTSFCRYVNSFPQERDGSQPWAGPARRGVCAQFGHQVKDLFSQVLQAVYITLPLLSVHNFFAIFLCKIGEKCWISTKSRTHVRFSRPERGRQRSASRSGRSDGRGPLALAGRNPASASLAGGGPGASASRSGRDFL